MNKNRVKRVPLSLLMISVMLMAEAITPAQTSSAEEAKKPLALGFGENERFILYSNGEVHRLLSQNQTLPLSKIQLLGEVVEATIIDFEVYGQNLYLYIYTSLNSSCGRTTVAVYNLVSGEKTFTKTYKFAVTQENQTQKVIGNMVLAASACPHAFAVITANTTHSLIEVYREKRGGFEKTATYSGRMAMSIYRCNETLIAATFKAEIKDNMPWITPQITDIVENKTLFSLPALIPVAALVYPFIQPFNRNNTWECHVTVYNQRMNRMEYYIVYPEKQGLIDSNATTVSPYMEYLIIDQKRGSKIIFSNGETITVAQKLSIIPQGAYMPLDPKNGVLDANPANKSILAKVVEGDKAKILYLTQKSTIELYTLNASSTSKMVGFHAALVQNTVYIINPENNNLLALSLKNIENREDNWGLTAAIALAGITITLIIILSLITHHKNKIMRMRGLIKP